MAAREVTPIVKHPAKYSEPVLEVAARLVLAEWKRLGREIVVLDPFAGVGRVHQLYRPGQIDTIGVELEREWAACHERTICGDSLTWMRQVADHGRGKVDVILTSPAYGNRFSDSHNARDGSTRRSYTHDLGHELTEGNSGALPWGAKYWAFHAEAYRTMLAVARRPYGDDPGTLFLLNVSDFVRGKARVPAVMWHRGACNGAGWMECDRPRLIETRRMRYGENHDARPDTETIMRLRPAA